MITVRHAEDRGKSNLGWLDSRHTFSFSDYYDPEHMGFSKLRVINDDRVAAGRGFGTHPHRDMEIISYVLEGAIEHKDSTGTGAILRPGEVQRMTAGTGVLHSEFNPSRTEPLHFVQIWITPERAGLAPSYEQREFPDLKGKLRLVASRDGREGSVTVHQDVRLFAGKLDGSDHTTLELGAGRRAWVQVAAGELSVNGRALTVGDGAAIEGETAIEFSSPRSAEVLVFDLP